MHVKNQNGLVVKKFSFFIVLMFLSISSLANPGAVDVLVSKDGIPLESYEVKIDEIVYKTDGFGFVTIGMKPGVHFLNIKDGESYQSIKFIVVEQERTQVLVNLLQGQVLSDLSEPEQKKIITKDEKKTWGKVKVQLTSISGEPVCGARIYARGTQVEAKTNRAGVADVSIPTGEHVLSVTHPKYSTQVVRNVSVSSDKIDTHRVELTPSGMVLEDFVILAPNLKGSIQALIEVRRKASDLSDVMSAEQMAKSGDSDAAGSLKRVTGLTLKDGKYVYVRGLGERYSSTLLNGISLPSPDPSRRVVPLDLFPVQFLDSMIIQKSYSPNQPGEFGGGVVQLKTKAMPEKFYAQISLSQTQNSNNGPLQTYQGGGSDWLGVDDGSRKLDPRAQQNPQVILQNNHHALEDQQNISYPEMAIAVGDSYKRSAFKVGYTLSGLYKDHINYQVEERNRYIKPEGTLVREDEYERQKTQKERTVGGIAGLQLELFKNHQVTANYINLRNSTDYVAILEGKNAEGNTIRENQIEWAARTLQTVMVQGENKIPSLNKIKFDWHFSQSKARRDEPYRIQSRYSPNSEGTFVFNPNDNTAYERRYYDLQERAEQRGLGVESPFPFFGKRKGKISLGLSKMVKARTSGMSRFSVDPTGTPCQANLSENLDSIFDTCEDSFRVTNTTRPTDNYFARQELTAYHFNSHWPLLQSLTLTSGMRFENSLQAVDTISPFEQSAISSVLNTRDWLPGSSLTWKMKEQMQLRLAYSETISRPDLRELSDTLWQDFETGYDVQGNPNLRATVINSYDARWEWYFAPKENVSFGVFYKEFDSPIEQVFTAGSDPRISFFNVQGASIYGAEVELSKNFSFLSRRLSAFSITGNFAYILSDVSLGDLQNSETTQTNRPLQGQSDYTANMLLDYDSESLKLNASLAYNVYGPRIAYTAPEGLPNVWEMPFHQLDFVLRKKMGKNWSLQTKIKNILNPQVRLEQEGQVWQAYRRGQSFTIGIGASI